MDAHRREEADSTTPAASETRPVRILCIEDDPDSVALVDAIVRHQVEAELVVARTGRAGLEMARARSPDLVILDLILPDVDGEEVLARLRRASDTASIPVVIVTSKSTADCSALAQHDAYVTKPVEDIAGFMEIVRRSLA